MTDMNRNEKNPMSQGNNPADKSQKRDDARNPNAPQREQGSQNRDVIGKPHQQGGAPRSEPSQPGHNAGLGHESDDTTRGSARTTEPQSSGPKPSQGMNANRGEPNRADRGADASRKPADASRKPTVEGAKDDKENETCCDE